jgi:hypothetical protein
VIEVQDALGNAVGVGGIEVTASITSGQVGATLVNFERNTNSSGIATFNNLRITGPPDDDYVLTFTAGSLIPVSSSLLTVTSGAANRIVIRTQPSASAQSGQAFAQQPVVEVVDATGNPVSGNRTIAVAIGDGAGTLSGTLTASTGTGSTATFTGLTITGVTGARTLIFSSGALTPAESNAINITAATTTTSLSAEPASSAEGQEVTFTATVTSGGGTPTGQVSFRDDGVEIGQGTLTAGVATFATSSLTASTHPITAHYLGDGSFSPSASSPLDYSVAAGNVAPSAQADAFNVNEDATLTVAADGVLGNDDDDDGDALTAQLVLGPGNAQSFALNSDGSFTYTPEAEFNGNDSFTYQANDGQANSNIATVTITVDPVNDDPGFTAGGNVSTSSLLTSILGESHSGWASGVSPGPPDESGQAVNFIISTDNDEAFQTTPEIDSAGNLTYRPGLRFDTIVVNATIIAEDNAGATSLPIDFTITITP